MKHRPPKAAPAPAPAPRLRRSQNVLDNCLVDVVARLEALRDRMTGQGCNHPETVTGPAGSYVARMEQQEALARRAQRLLAQIEEQA